jgi:hypothetical protein
VGDAFFPRSARVTTRTTTKTTFPDRRSERATRGCGRGRTKYGATITTLTVFCGARTAPSASQCARDEAERDALGLPESVTLLPVCARDAETARRAFRGGRGEGVESVERDGEANEDVTDARLDKKKQTRKRALVPSFDAFERERSRRRAAIRESSIFSGPGVVANESDVRDNARNNAVTLAGVARQNSPDSVSLDNFGAGTLRRQVPREKKRAAMDGELFGIYSSPRSGARGRGYVPTASAAARAGGARGVQARHALVVAQRASPRERKGASNRARAVALANGAPRRGWASARRRTWSTDDFLKRLNDAVDHINRLHSYFQCISPVRFRPLLERCRSRRFRAERRHRRPEQPRDALVGD